VEQQFDARAVRQALGVDDVTYLGTGNFGETWRAPLAGRDTACKIIYRPGYSAERLDREIAGYRRVSSPHVVTLHDAMTIIIAGDERVCLVFEYIAGGDRGCPGLRGT
jgi:serine/threonine protein kinase